MMIPLARRSLITSSPQYRRFAWLADLSVRFWNLRSARAESTGGTLTVDDQLPEHSVHLMPLHLGGVMAYLIEGKDLLGVDAEHLLEGLAGQMGQCLTIGEGTVDPGIHRSIVTLPLWAAEGSTGQVTIGKLDAILLGSLNQDLYVVRADLVAQGTAATVNADEDLVGEEAIDICGIGGIDLLYHLHLQIVIAGA